MVPIADPTGDWPAARSGRSVAAVLALTVNTTGYRVLAILHILAAFVAFGPLFMYPSLQRAGAGATLAKLQLRLVLPALALTGILGIALVGSSEDVFSMSQTWVVLSIIGWVILLVVSWFLVRPAITDSSAAARGRLASGVGITHLLLIVMLYLMVFHPGL
jgi:hypothetical protein